MKPEEGVSSRRDNLLIVGMTQQRWRGPEDPGREIVLLRTGRGQGVSLGTFHASVDPLGTLYLAGREWEPLKASLSKEMTS